MDKYTFFPLAFRMKYINRWGLMRNTDDENLLEHSAECAMLVHALCVIGNTYFGKMHDVGNITLKALYHDISEIYTGDLPTPVKYHNHLISSSYKDIERGAVEKLIGKLPEEMRAEYDEALDHDSEEETALLIKGADKLAALIKCMKEINNGNKEFNEALDATRSAVEKLADKSEEIRFFCDNFLSEFDKTLDEL